MAFLSRYSLPTFYVAVGGESGVGGCSVVDVAVVVVGERLDGARRSFAGASRAD